MNRGIREDLQIFSDFVWRSKHPTSIIEVTCKIFHFVLISLVSDFPRDKPNFDGGLFVRDTLFDELKLKSYKDKSSVYWTGEELVSTFERGLLNFN